MKIFCNFLTKHPFHKSISNKITSIINHVEYIVINLRYAWGWRLDDLSYRPELEVKLILMRVSLYSKNYSIIKPVFLCLTEINDERQPNGKTLNNFNISFVCFRPTIRFTDSDKRKPQRGHRKWRQMCARHVPNSFYAWVNCRFNYGRTSKLFIGQLINVLARFDARQPYAKRIVVDCG